MFLYDKYNKAKVFLKRNELVRSFSLVNRLVQVYCGSFTVGHLLSDSSVFTTAPMVSLAMCLQVFV